MPDRPPFDPTMFPARNPSRRCKTSDWETLETPLAAKRATKPCPHTAILLRSTRVFRTKQCDICQEKYFDTPEDGEEVIPVKLGCDHIFCRDCVESLRSCGMRCPWQWCAELAPQPDCCKLCAYWLKAQGSSVVVTIHASEMTASIRNALAELSDDDDYYKLSKQSTYDFLDHLRKTLRRFEWQYHTGTDLAELLDPFLVALDMEDAREYYGPGLCKPALDPSVFPPRENDPDDYPTGQEPWIAAFIRRWALDYEKEHGKAKEGWGEWARKSPDQSPDCWDWMFKRIMAHRTEVDGTIKYLVKWIGKRFGDSWITREQIGDEAIWRKYDNAHGVVQPPGKDAQPVLWGTKRKNRGV